MENPPTPDQRDTSRRFLFEAADIRGETVHLNESLAEVLATHQYAPGVSRLLGEFMAASVLLTTTLKYEGSMILQARSEGQVPLMMAECTSDLKLRAIARGAQEATSEAFDVLLSNGQLVITIDPLKGERYQGIVPLVENSLARSLDAYFHMSEQLHTRFWLACDGQQAAGMLLQQLPSQVQPDPQAREAQWQHVCTLSETLADEELLALPAREILTRLFHQEPTRLFESRTPRFWCSCTRERTFNALSAVGAEEVESLLQEQGSVTMDCEFCSQQYVFQREELEDILQPHDRSQLH